MKVIESYSPRYAPVVAPIYAEGADSDLTDATLVTSLKRDETFYSSVDYVAAYELKLTTPKAIAEYLLSVINEPPHNLAFVDVRAEFTLRAAQESTERYEKGVPLGPLDGVPVVVKDELDIHGYTKTFGSAKIFGSGEGETTWCVKKLEDAGAIIIGKANMHELGTGALLSNHV